VNFGEQLRGLRLQHGMTQQRLAELLGCGNSTISMYEAGKREPDFETLEAIADVFNVPMSRLMGDTDRGNCAAISGILPIRRKHVPLLGDIAAGVPIYAEEQHETYVAVNDDTVCDFALRVQGDSMTGAHINDGDIVFVRSQPDVDDGQIGVVVIGDCATLKHVYHIPGGVQLVANNPAYPPMIYQGDDASQVRILGRAVAYQHKLT
jgi:repressor LexA